MDIQEKYKYGFTTDVESEQLPAGLNEETIIAIHDGVRPLISKALIDNLIAQTKKWIDQSISFNLFSCSISYKKCYIFCSRRQSYTN